VLRPICFKDDEPVLRACERRIDQFAGEQARAPGEHDEYFSKITALSLVDRDGVGKFKRRAVRAKALWPPAIHTSADE
jgi:hypothetical protein